MADFKLGIAGSEYDLPTGVAEELPSEASDRFVEAEMQDGSFVYNAKEKCRRTWAIDFGGENGITGTDCDTLDAIAALGVELNYINGYQGLAAGVSVVCLNWSGRRLIVETSGLTTPRYRGTMVLKEVV